MPIFNAQPPTGIVDGGNQQTYFTISPLIKH